MFEKIEKKYIQIGCVVLAIMLITLVILFLFINWKSVISDVAMVNRAMTPVYIGLIIAYLLNPVMIKIEKGMRLVTRKILKKPSGQKALARGFSIFIVLAVGISFVVEIFMMVIPQLVDSITLLINNLPENYQSFLKWLEEFSKSNPDMVSYIKDITNQAYDQIMIWLKSELLPSSSKLIIGVSDSIINLFGVMFDLFIGIIFSIYLMANKELFAAQSKRMIYSILKEKHANGLLDLLKETNIVFGKFINGKILDSLIVGILTFFIMTIAGIPYAMLISVLIGVTNIIPFFGQYIGAIPSTILVLLVSPMKGVIFLILIIIIMQVDGNIIGPKILGGSIGLGSFWILFSILIFGSLFGLVGMIVAVPLFAMFFQMVKKWSASRLKKKQLPVETKYYMTKKKITSAKNDK